MEMEIELPESTNTIDKDGIRTEITWSINNDGKVIKTTTKFKKVIKKIRVNKNVERRKKLLKFGDCKDISSSENLAVTYVSPDDIFFKKSDNIEKEENKVNKEIVSVKKCRNCGGNHWTVKCTSPHKKVEPAEQHVKDKEKKGIYVPVHLREKLGDICDHDIRISNLPEEARESDIHDLFDRFGYVKRIKIIFDRKTNQSKGYAYISFTSQSDAENAIKTLDQHPYGNLILQLSWAKKKQNNPPLP